PGSPPVVALGISLALPLRLAREIPTSPRSTVGTTFPGGDLPAQRGQLPAAQISLEIRITRAHGNRERIRRWSGGHFPPRSVSVQAEGRFDLNGGAVLNALETVALYYDAWQSRHGNLNDVPLADDFEFTGPVASFDSAERYRAMAREAGQAVTSFNVRRQFVDGNAVCSIIDWEMAIPGVGPMTSAELLEVVDGVIVRGELIYDAELLRRSMAQSTA